MFAVRHNIINKQRWHFYVLCHFSALQNSRKSCLPICVWSEISSFSASLPIVTLLSMGVSPLRCFHTAHLHICIFRASHLLHQEARRSERDCMELLNLNELFRIAWRKNESLHIVAWKTCYQVLRANATSFWVQIIIIFVFISYAERAKTTSFQRRDYINN